MLTHAQIWMAIDRLALRSRLSASGLAKRAGLDPTTFNKSKRITADGRPRWPSTESISKSLTATGVTLAQFVALIGDDAPHGGGAGALPLIGLDEADADGRFDADGLPTGGGWDAIPFPGIDDNSRAYAVEINGDALAPVYRDGTHIVVSPAVPVRRGDRVVVRTRDGEMLVKELKRKTARTLELRSLVRDGNDAMLAADEVAWVARVMWASQ